MKIPQVNRIPVPVKNATLYGLVANLIHEAAPLAVHNRNSVVNNVPMDVHIDANGAIVSSVLSKLFNTIIRHTQNCGILISAKVYGMVVLVQVKSKGNISPGLPEDMGQVSLKAQKTGGVIEITGYENKEASVAYCFLNIKGAA
jgi:hypothetical protein